MLKALKLDIRDPNVQALVLVAQRYDVDVILGHVCLVNGRVMVTKSGLLHVAHRSGDHDGHEVDVEEKQDRFVATARVYRKSMSRPIEFTDECLKSERVQSPRKRARTRALRNALAEAYDIAIPVYEEEDRPLPRLSQASSFGDEPPILESFEPTVNGRPVEDVAHGPGEEGTAAEGSSPSPGLSGRAKALMVRFSALAMPEEARHALIGWVTGGRSESIKNVNDEEAAELHMVLHQIRNENLPEGVPSVVVEWFEQRSS